MLKILGMDSERFILAIDGGGIRGIIPAYILSRLSSILKDKGDTRPLYSHFDLIAGTSTGALIAGALSVPAEGTSFTPEDGDESPVYGEYHYRRFFRKHVRKYLKGTIQRSADPDEFVSLYASHGPEIFPSRSVKSIFGPLFTDKYDAKPYEAFLQRMYGERKMGELMVPTAFITYSANEGCILPITSWGNMDSYIWEGARASSAAPLYFPPYRLDGRYLIDGGVAANNPSLIAYSLSRKLYPEAEKHSILSLSTEEPVFHYEPDLSFGGLTGWASPLTRIFQDAELRTADFTAENIKDVEYTRIWTGRSERRIKLDETKSDTIRLLLDIAESLFQAKETELMKFAERIANEPTHESVRIRTIDRLA